MRDYSQFEKWILDTYRGESPVAAMLAAADIVRKDSGQNVFPIQLSRIAASLGMNPQPLFLDIVEDGNLIMREGELRIALRRSSKYAIKNYGRNIGRHRFTYAHEIAHSFFYDLKSSPPKRIAPRADRNEEEVICNHIARELLLPKELLQAEINNRAKIDASFIVSVAKKAIVSIQALVLQLCDRRTLKIPLGSFYLLSKDQNGSGGKGVKKPRCVTGIWNDGKGKPIPFLPPYKGLDSVKPLSSNAHNWSLVSYHLSLYKGMYSPVKTIENEIVLLPQGTRAEISATHERIQKSLYVWTAGIARIL